MKEIEKIIKTLTHVSAELLKFPTGDEEHEILRVLACELIDCRDYQVKAISKAEKDREICSCPQEERICEWLNIDTDRCDYGKI